MKKCGKCKTYLEDNDFSFRKGRLHSFCKSCQKECSKKYREKNETHQFGAKCTNSKLIRPYIAGVDPGNCGGPMVKTYRERIQ